MHLTLPCFLLRQQTDPPSPKMQIVPDNSAYFRFDDISKPEVQAMNDLLGGQGLVVKQHNSECCRCFCCQPNIDWDVHALNSENEERGNYDGPATMNVRENAGKCGRTFSWFAPGCRATKYTVRAGQMGK